VPTPATARPIGARSAPCAECRWVAAGRPGRGLSRSGVAERPRSTRRRQDDDPSPRSQEYPRASSSFVFSSATAP
jgi:hypothetical protein